MYLIGHTVYQNEASTGKSYNYNNYYCISKTKVPCKAQYWNRPLPSSLVPLFQSESKYETIVIKVTLICMKMKLYVELIFKRKVLS